MKVGKWFFLKKKLESSELDGFHLAWAHLNSHSEQNNTQLWFLYIFYSLAGLEIMFAFKMFISVMSSPDKTATTLLQMMHSNYLKPQISAACNVNSTMLQDIVLSKAFASFSNIFACQIT